MKRRSLRLVNLAVALAVAALAGASVFVHLRGADAEKGRSFAYFSEHVAPVLATTCSARDETGAFVCHGHPAGRFDEAGEVELGTDAKMPHMVPGTLAASCATSCHRVSGRQRFSFPIGGPEGIGSDRQRLLAFEKAAGLAGFSGGGRFAKLLRMPLGAQAGGFGLYHGGGEVFDGAADPRFRRLAEWVEIDSRRRAEAQREVGEAERFFRDEVLPVFARNTCLAPSCHIFNHSSFVLDPGIPTGDLSRPLPERFTPEQVSFNRMTAKGLIQTLVNLTGDVEQSRILAKNIPIEKGGVLHRGGNDQFLSGPEDPDYQVIAQWLRLERAEAIAGLRIGGEPVAPEDVGRVRGVVFVRTPTQNHRRYLDVGRYLPGGDLFLLELGEDETLETASGTPVNLTARFHPDSEADVREPDVRYDGRAILFAMRIGESDRLNLYEIALDDGLDYVEGSFRRLSYGPPSAGGIPVHFTDPTYVPDPLDDNAAAGGVNLERADVVFASNLAGEVVQSVERGLVGEADGGDELTILDLDRPERDGSFVGRRIQIVDGTNRGHWRTIAGFENRLFGREGWSRIQVDRPFPEPVDETSVYVIERAPETQPGFLPAYSVYGIKYAPPGEERRIYQQTLTRVTWNPGQDLDLSVRSTGEVFYASQRSGCDKYGRPIFHIASCRRHLDTRFSFPTHHGNRSQVLVYADNHELVTGIDVHVGLDPDNLWEGGNLSVSDHQFGPGLEARNPHDFTAGLFGADGVPRALRPDISNTRFVFERGEPAHPRAMFKKIALFPVSGPQAVTRTGFSPGGIFRDPVPLPDGGILVSHSAEPIDHLDPEAAPDFDLYLLRGDPGLQPAGGKGTPRVRIERLERASAVGVSDVQAVPIYVRLKPKINAARRPRREHLIRYPGSPADTRPARYLERNYLLIDAIMRDPAPVGKHAAYARDPVAGSRTERLDRVVGVRMVEALPMTRDLAAPLDAARVRNGDPESTLVSNGIHPMKRMVGEAPLESDGSIFLRVPSRTPLVIQSLNPDGMALRQEARYYFFAPNETFTVSPSRSETFQTCGACMGSMTGRPQDLFGPINPFSGQGRVEALAGRDAQPTDLALEAGERLSIDFVRDVQPLLDRHCAGCHSGESGAPGPSLTGARTHYYNDAYESLHALEDPQSGWYGRKRYVSERAALAIESYLIEKVFGRELKAPRPLSGDAPHPSPALFEAAGLEPRPLSPEQRMLLVRWIDLGAAFRGPATEERVARLGARPQASSPRVPEAVR